MQQRLKIAKDLIFRNEQITESSYDQLGNEIRGSILGLISTFLIISLTSYMPIDTFLLRQARITHIKNLGGIVGSIVSEFILGNFGAAGFLAIFIAIWMSICAFRGILFRSQVTRWLGVVFAAALLAISLHLYFYHTLPEASPLQGGWIGIQAGNFLLEYFNKTGSLLIVVTGFAITFMMSTRIFLSHMIHKIFVETGSSRMDFSDSTFEDDSVVPQVQSIPVVVPLSQSNKLMAKKVKAPRKSRKKALAADASMDEEDSNEDTLNDGDSEGDENDSEELTGSDDTQAVSAPVQGFQHLIPFKAAYSKPSTRLLKDGANGKGMSGKTIRQLSNKLVEHLLSFQITGEITDVTEGPVLTTYEYKPSAGVKLSKIAALQDDLGIVLGTNELRIVAPIPGKNVVGIEVPRPETDVISLKDIISDGEFNSKKIKLPVAIGKSTSGEPVIGDLAAMPHLLVAGSTGSGKSVFINSLIMSLIYRLSPQELRLILVDPKMLELSVFDGIPHLVTNVITDNDKAFNALSWAVEEMERRYQLMAQTNSKNIESFNSKKRSEKLPYIVIVIDELADLMMSGGEKAEIAITRLAQKARAAGIHLVLATQRPSTDVVTGLIKANIPSRISFKVPSGIDSRTVLDTGGAETLLGRGDSLMIQSGTPLRRYHGCFVSEEELARVINYVKGGKDHSKHYINFPDSIADED